MEQELSSGGDLDHSGVLGSDAALVPMMSHDIALECFDYERASALIELAPTADEVKVLRDQAARLSDYAKSRHADFAKQFDLAVLRLDCERKIGRLLSHTIRERGRYSTDPVTGQMRGSVSMLPTGISPDQSSDWQLESKLPQTLYREWIAMLRAFGKASTSAGLRREAKPYSIRRKQEHNLERSGREDGARVAQVDRSAAEAIVDRSVYIEERIIKIRASAENLKFFDERFADLRKRFRPPATARRCWSLWTMPGRFFSRIQTRPTNNARRPDAPGLSSHHSGGQLD